MKRRDILKAIGIGGIGAVATVISPKEAPSPQAALPTSPQRLAQPGSIYVGHKPLHYSTYASGTATYSPELVIDLSRPTWGTV